MMNKIFKLTILSIFIMVLSTAFVSLCHAADDAATFQSYFMSKGCVGCHNLNGNGGEVGPHLDGVGARHDKIWIIQQLKDPKSHKPDGIMPQLNLKDDEIQHIANYLSTLK